MDIESIIKKDGFYMTAAKGVSMRPLIRAGRDTVCIVKADPPLLPFEIMLYRTKDKYVLHRLIKAEAGGKYLFLGDNCATPEHVDEKQIAGRLKLLYRDEKEIHLDSFLLRMYTLLWIRPWRMRIFILRLRNKIKGRLGKFHAEKE